MVRGEYLQRDDLTGLPVSCTEDRAHSSAGQEFLNVIAAYIPAEIIFCFERSQDLLHCGEPRWQSLGTFVRCKQRPKLALQFRVPGTLFANEILTHRWVQFESLQK